jgi:putative addiction module killer protein
LKFKFAGGLRVYFGMKGKTFILLLCGGNKRRQSNDINKALEYWKDYNEQTK